MTIQQRYVPGVKAKDRPALGARPSRKDLTDAWNAAAFYRERRESRVEAVSMLTALGLLASSEVTRELLRGRP